jgi:hypothetical protein
VGDLVLHTEIDIHYLPVQFIADTLFLLNQRGGSNANACGLYLGDAWYESVVTKTILVEYFYGSPVTSGKCQNSISN